MYFVVIQFLRKHTPFDSTHIIYNMHRICQILSPFTTKDFRLCFLGGDLDWYCAVAVLFSNTIQLCASDKSQRKTRALLTFPKYPTSGEAKAPKPVSSSVIGKPPLLLWSTGFQYHSTNITMSLQPGSPPEELGRPTQHHTGQRQRHTCVGTRGTTAPATVYQS